MSGEGQGLVLPPRQRNYSPWYQWMTRLNATTHEDPLPEGDLAALPRWLEGRRARLHELLGPMPTSVPLNVETIESVELSGAGPAFCSGGDLDEFGTADDLVAAYLVRLSRAPWRVIDRIAAKVTVLAHGACVGAGTEMAAYAGRVVAAPDATRRKVLVWPVGMPP